VAVTPPFCALVEAKPATVNPVLSALTNAAAEAPAMAVTNRLRVCIPHPRFKARSRESSGY
jgi:hypothetical protein